MTTDRRGKGRQWERARRLVLHRAGWRCQRCGRYVSTGRRGGLAGEVHHVDGDRTHCDPARLELVCSDCHHDAHRPPVTPEAAAWRALVDSMMRRGLQ